MKSCVVCGRSYVVPARRGGPPKVADVCSETCRLKHYRLRLGKWTSGEERSCVRCSQTFTPHQERQQVCSAQCGWLHRTAVRPKNADWLQGRQVERPVKCRDCGVESVARASRWRCPPCSKLARADIDRRKSLQRRGATPGRISVRAIGARDGWRCHLCSRGVNPNLSGMDQMGPTIDHLVPISAGGADTPLNVALAHRQCNTRRGARGIAQLRLVA